LEQILPVICGGAHEYAFEAHADSNLRSKAPAAAQNKQQSSDNSTIIPQQRALVFCRKSCY
jgi:hypothetical protein